MVTKLAMVRSHQASARIVRTWPHSDTAEYFRVYVGQRLAESGENSAGALPMLGMVGAVYHHLPRSIVCA